MTSNANPEPEAAPHKTHLLQRIVEVFLQGNLSVMLIAISLLLGAAALYITPREEEPQIVVPLADVYIHAPGLSAEQVERQISTRLEKLLYQIDGVEYVYSMSRAGSAIVTVRFYVGENREDSLVKIYNKLQANIDDVPADVTGWVVKPIEIDDVPIVNITLWSEDEKKYDDYALRRLAEELEIELQAVKNTNRTEVIGGRPREVRVLLNPEQLAARQTTPLEVAWALGVSNVRMPAGQFDQHNQSFLVDAGTYIGGVNALEDLVIAVVDGAPVYLKDMAEIIDGPAEQTSYTWLGFGPGVETKQYRKHAGEEMLPPPEIIAQPGFFPAVNIAVAKKKGCNAVWVAEAVKEKMDDLAATHLPDGVHARITRNYGETANDKVNELVEGLAVAILIVIGLIALSLGWREGLIVAVAVPITFSLTLMINYLLGYTINRVTLFALILALGLVVDDPIVDVENIFRHFKMRKEPPHKAVITAVNEVRPPIILATLAVIVSFIPLFFITGMMGPYMAPMALNVPLSMLMSLVVAFTITPWMSYHVLKGEYNKAQEAEYALEETLTWRIYCKVVGPFLQSRKLAFGLLAAMAGLMGFAMFLGANRSVPLKMLPFDNKNEFQIVIDMPEGTTLESTDAAARELANYLRTVPEVADFTLYSGLASPMDFNGMVRHYYMRQGENVADIRVNLINKDDRAQQSHAMLLRIRNDLEAIATKHDANIKLVESPPGPPVISTITAEVYGAPNQPYEQLQDAAYIVAERLRREGMVVDVDTTVEADQTRWIFDVDKEKAALSGVSTEDVAQTLRLALDGMPAARMQIASEVNPLQIRLRISRDQRSSIEQLRTLYIKGRQGIAQIRESSGLRAAPVPLVQLGELGSFREETQDKTIYHKNLERVAYVFADTAGRAPAEAIIDMIADFEGTQAKSGAPYIADAQASPVEGRTYFSNGAGIKWQAPQGTRVVWNGEGEWKITLDVFRDLGLAFAAACLGIYILLVYQTGSYLMPLILMISIPLTIIGIMPGFWLLNHFGDRLVGGFPNPTFFTATGMIGMIALAGIAVRNAILLIEFVHEALRKGVPFRDALLQSGAIRFRPIFLTAGTAMLAAIPITLDPIFSGLAWALIFGLTVSTVFTLAVIPVTYDLVYRNKPGHGLPPEPIEE
ncbi:efflux RND transporter permease subunit [Candidatus Sumerlaeota bacterium]|nr:efflux RND transporter permease subunit [Candidatus Sumerlaeota bacterium]